MNCNSMLLYAQMQKELNELETFCGNEVMLIEKCFNIAIHYWNKIKINLLSFTFTREEEEINFFKNIKPLFIAVIEYYTLHYQAVLFKPVNDKAQLILYWTHELKRAELFFNRHSEFYHYYLTGQTNKDSDYFTRKASIDHTNKKATPKTPASYDDIAARIIAFRQYNDYAVMQLNMLLPGNNKAFFMEQYLAAI